MSLVMDPARIYAACDPYGNPMWKKASQLTAGVDGMRPAEAFREDHAVSAWAAKLAAALQTGICSTEVALKIQDIPKQDPWELDGTLPLGVRSIVVRSIFGRCLSNHLSAILQETSEAVLPSCAVAYRVGMHDAGREAILLAASAIGIDGFKYWAKLDVRDCFNSMSRAKVAAAMARMGYPLQFVRLVMTTVGAPRYRRRQGSWVQQNSDKGCPAGLPESSILINILFESFDRDIERGFPGLVYTRYSDDLLILGRKGAEVEAAVAKLLAWIRGVELTLKGVSPNQSPASLVHCIDERPLIFLGAEIRPDGSIGIPAATFEAQLAKVRYMLDRAAHHPSLVVGQSRYAQAGRRAAGIPTHDWEDVRSSIAEFHRYWSGLDRGEAKVFLARAKEEFLRNPFSNASHFRKVWGAALGDADSLIGGGTKTDQENTSDPSERWVSSEVVPHIHAVLSGSPPDSLWDEVLADLDHELAGTSDPGIDERSAPEPWGHREDEQPSGSYSTPAREPQQGPPATGPIANELYGSALEACGFSARPRGSAVGCESSGHTAQGSALPPGEPRVAPIRLIFVKHDFDSATDRTRVTTNEFSASGEERGTWTMVFDDLPPESSVVEQLIHRLRSTRGERVIIAMHRAWLPKLLLQQGREVRSVGFFRQIQRLHEVGKHALIIGPIRGLEQRQGG